MAVVGHPPHLGFLPMHAFVAAVHFGPSDLDRKGGGEGLCGCSRETARLVFISRLLRR